MESVCVGWPADGVVGVSVRGELTKDGIGWAVTNVSLTVDVPFCTSARERHRRRYQKMIPISSDTPTTAPAMPPAIGPECDLFGFELDDEVAPAGDGETAVGLGVASGESPALCAALAIQFPVRVTSRYAQWGTRIPSGIGNGNVEGGAVEEQLKDH